MTHLILHTDGGSRGNPGPAGVGVVLIDADTGQTRHEAGYFLGHLTSNQAEYQALLRGLEVARTLSATRITLRADSQLMVRQLANIYKVKNSDLKRLHTRAMDQLYQLEDGYELEHIPREANERADELANHAMDRSGDYIVPGGDIASGSTDAEPAPPLAFTATLVPTRSSGQRSCHAGQATGSPYHFGPRTPEGFCLHAAAAALGRHGPLHWPASTARGHATCGTCNLRIELESLPAS